MERGAFFVRFRRPIGVGFVVLVIAALGEIAPTRYGTPGAFLRGAWLAVAAIGLGWLLRRLACPAARTPLALQMVLGLGVLVLASGPFVALHGFVPAVRFGLLGAGVAAALAGVQLDPPKLRVRLGGAEGVMLAIVVCASILVASQATERLPQKMNDDDGPLYLVLVKQLIQTGSMFQPFSFRRAQSLGGQSVLQSLLVHRADLSASDVLFFDQGFAALGVLALVLVEARSARAAILSAIYLLVIPVSLHANTGAESSGLLFLLGAIMLARRERARMLEGSRLALLAVLLAAACALRQNYFIFAALLGAWILVSSGRGAWRRRATDTTRCAGILGVTATLLLVPYFAASWRDVGTPLYPLFAGHVRPAAAGVTGVLQLHDRVVTLFKTFLTAGWSGFGLAPFLLVALLARTRWKRPFAPGWLLALLVLAILAQWSSLPLISPEGNVRYAYPMILCFVLIILADIRRMPLAEGLVAAVVGIVGLCAQHGPELAASLQASFTTARGPGPPAEVEALVPRGASIVVLAERAYLFDADRNGVHALDFPGVVTPDGGWPSSAPELRAALRRWGYDALVVQTQGMTGLYKRDDWKGHLESADPALKAMAPNMTHGLQMLDEIARGAGATRAGDYVVVDLARP